MPKLNEPSIDQVKEALEELKEHTQYVRILGCYQSETLQAVSVNT